MWRPYRAGRRPYRLIGRLSTLPHAKRRVARATDPTSLVLVRKRQPADPCRRGLLPLRIACPPPLCGLQNVRQGCAGGVPHARRVREHPFPYGGVHHSYSEIIVLFRSDTICG
jgi:hypothetical protein